MTFKMKQKPSLYGLLVFLYQKNLCAAVLMTCAFHNDVCVFHSEIYLKLSILFQTDFKSFELDLRMGFGARCLCVELNVPLILQFKSNF